jgi:glycolate oxidase iron-sulfur subunit
MMKTFFPGFPHLGTPSKMARLAVLLKDLESDLSKCARCGMCMAVCPLYGETRNETDVARGKLALLDGMKDNLFDHPRGVMERLNRCLLCGACGKHCPNSVDTQSIFLKARTILTQVEGLSPVKKYILKKMLAHPERFEKWVARGAKYQHRFIQKKSLVLGTASMGFIPALKERHFIPLAAKSFHQSVSGNVSEPVTPDATALFYPGCLIDYVFPNIGQAVVKALHHHHIRVILPVTSACCGMPAMAAGDRETAEKLMRMNLEQFNKHPFDHLITACPTCAHTLKKIWPLLVQRDEDDVASLVSALGKKTLDISQFMVSIPPLKEVKAGQSALEDVKIITYHDPCHLKKSLAVDFQPRALISENREYRLVEMKNADQCCGMGGSFGIEHYDLSNRIGQTKLANILATNCHTVASGCPACMMQLAHLLSASGSGILVKHPIEIYAEKIGG